MTVFVPAFARLGSSGVWHRVHRNRRAGHHSRLLLWRPELAGYSHRAL